MTSAMFGDLTGLSGQTIEMGTFLSLTGQGTQYGKVMGNGQQLAAMQIKAAGGPDIQFKAEDNGSGDPAKGAQAARSLAGAGISAIMSSQSFNVGAALPVIAAEELFTIDPGGGTFFFWGQPYAWGAKAIVFYDSILGATQFIKEADLGTKVAYVGVDLGGDFTDQQVAQLKKGLDANGLEFVGSPETHALGATDFSTVVTRVNESDPDVIVLFNYGNDSAIFMNQYIGAGGTATVIGSDYTLDAAEIAGDSYEDYYFAFDYFDVEAPSNDWAECFVEAYRAEYGEDPDAYAAGFYESTFIMWKVFEQTLADGGDITSGPDLDASFRSIGSFPSVFGGEGETPGEIAFSDETHSVASRTIQLRKANIDQPELLATYDVDGSNFSMD